MRLLALALLIAAASALAQSSPSLAGGTTFTVDSQADLPDSDTGDAVCGAEGGVCTLRAAVMQSNATGGDNLVNLPAGTYILTIAPAAGDPAASGDLVVDGNLAIIGAGRDTTIIDGNDTDRIFENTVGSELTLNGMTLRDGSPPGDNPFGGAVLSGDDSGAGSTLTLDDVLVMDSEASVGGGIAAFGNLFIEDSTVRGNLALNSGGGIYFDENGADQGMEIERSQITENTSQDAFGGMATYGHTELSVVSVTANTATNQGGGLGIFDLTTIVSSNVEGNTVTSDATNGSGGGIVTANTPLDIDFSAINGNTAAGRGGGLMMFSDFDDPDQVSISRSTIDGNTAGAGGGGIRMGRSDGEGGGLLTVTESSITRNTASSGGGVYNFSPSNLSELLLINVTLSGNSVTNAGGGLRSIGAEASNLIAYSTIADNEADEAAGGISQSEGAEVELENTILADNTAATNPECEGDVKLGGPNLVGETSAGCNLSGLDGDDFLDEDPLIGPLAFNGGGAETHALSPSSPAIDEGSSCPPPATDQRGVARPQGDACDLGAHEAVAAVIWGDYDCSGEVTLADTLPQLEFMSGAAQTPITGCPAVGTQIGGDRTWGNTDCFSGGTVLPVDVVVLLAFFAGFGDDYDRATGCPSLGDPVEG